MRDINSGFLFNIDVRYRYVRRYTSTSVHFKNVNVMKYKSKGSIHD